MKTDRFLGKVLWALFGVLVLFSCVNERSEVDKVTQEDEIPVESTFDSEIYYSENADMKIRAFAPEMHRYIGDEASYNEMPKGVEVFFYDSLNQESSSLKSNYAIDRQSEYIMEAKYDVVVINEDGDMLNTEHLIWDRKAQKIYSDVFVKITTEDEIIMGEGFESNETFTKYKILKPKGTITQVNDEDD